ncbi:LppX_LprAFG lipoprotein [Haloechinothrix sp. LS1_15]|uniref:LppX_LprAFG lipoprotein n=1 Tax=Haloechinothrix sp. LS1_15 TaxID=2652248 RepID=UPI00294788EB|nr:LppX_LprAFG lipoprotein [Haloechinothrix sp. LS1_15]MDV6012974.1 LppX_LprAFG lipoprotein [Haloechinothrix sp. LS1_15]
MVPHRTAGRAVACLLAALALVASACSEDAEDLPEAGTLLDRASAAAAEVTSARFTLHATGDVPGLTVQAIEGDLTTEGGPYGAAQGTATLSVGGQLVESEFVLHSETLHLETPGGGFQEIRADRVAAIYDPSAVLDPERGVANLLTQVREAETVGTETVDGTATYEVDGTVAHEAFAELIPGVTSDAEITLWLTEEGDHLPVRVSLTFPDAESAEDADTADTDDAPTVEVTLSQVNEPVTVSPPESGGE